MKSSWNVKTLHSLMLQMFASADLRYQQRFDAQQGALLAALMAQEKAVSAALVAAEKAVIKAENASEKRFEAVNEFRGQLTDQALTFPSKELVEAQFAAVKATQEAFEAIVNTQLVALRSYNDKEGGERRGKNLVLEDQTRRFNRSMGLAVVIVSIVAVITGILVKTIP